MNSFESLVIDTLLWYFRMEMIKTGSFLKKKLKGFPGGKVKRQ